MQIPEGLDGIPLRPDSAGGSCFSSKAGRGSTELVFSVIVVGCPVGLKKVFPQLDRTPQPKYAPRPAVRGATDVRQKDPLFHSETAQALEYAQSGLVAWGELQGNGR